MFSRSSCFLLLPLHFLGLRVAELNQSWCYKVDKKGAGTRTEEAQRWKEGVAWRWIKHAVKRNQCEERWGAAGAGHEWELAAASPPSADRCRRLVCVCGRPLESVPAWRATCCGWVTSDVHTKNVVLIAGDDLFHTCSSELLFWWNLCGTWCWKNPYPAALVSEQHRQHESSVQQIAWVNNIHTKCLLGLWPVNEKHKNTFFKFCELIL